MIATRDDTRPGGKTWDRLDGETDKAWSAFRLYLGLGRGRSLDGLAGALDPAKASRRKRAATGCLQSWSSRYRWVERARAYDLHLADVAAEAEAEELRLDVSEAAARRREYRARAAKLAERLHQRLEATIEATPTPDPKQIRELVLAGERLGLVEARAFAGLERAEAAPPELEEMPPELARLVEQWHAGRGPDGEPLPGAV
jgi:hypothetical protein